MTRRILVSLALIALFLAAGGSAAAWLMTHKPKPEATVPNRPVLVVSALRVAERTVVEPILGFGTARADHATRISTQVSGEVVERGANVKDGAPVEEGQLLIRIDDREYQAQLQRARSTLKSDQAQLAQLDQEDKNLQRLIDIAQDELEIAQREYDRVRDLIERDAANPREFDTALGEFKRARRTLLTLENQKSLLPDRKAAQAATCDMRRAEVALAELNVEHCTLVAPFDGRLDSVAVEVGERVAPGNQICELVDPTLIEVPIELPISVRSSLSVGAACILSIESRPGADWSGQVRRIAPVANEATRTFNVFVEVDNRLQPQQLMPGAFVQARIAGRSFENATAIPRGCIQSDRVFMCIDGVATPRAVTVVRHLLDLTIVTGLEPGELVITSNFDALEAGTPVQLDLPAGGRPRPRAAAGGGDTP